MDAIIITLENFVVAIETLQSENDKYVSTLMILKSAPAPWPPVLNKLIRYGDGGHYLAQEIYTENKNQSIKVLKKEYGWPIDLPEKDLKLLVKRIVSANSLEMMQDVQSVLENAGDITVQANFYLVLMLVKTYRSKCETRIEKKNCDCSSNDRQSGYGDVNK